MTIRGADHEKLPWVTIDRAFSHLTEARLPEEHAGTEGIRFTATSTTAIQNVIGSGAAKGFLPHFVGRQDPNLQVVDDLPNLTRPLWIMWRDNALDLPHFSSVIGWLLHIIGDEVGLTPEGQAFSRKLKSEYY